MEYKLDPKLEAQFNRALSFRNIAILLAVIGLVWLLLVKVISVDLTCSRSLSGYVECGIVKHTLIFEYTGKITEPVAADLDAILGNKGVFIYNAEIRTKSTTDALPLMSSRDHDHIREAVDKINSFLLSSNESSFSLKF
jgi:hypothetical protein